MVLEKIYPKQISVLKDLFSEEGVQNKINRLNSIYSHSKQKWCENLKRFNDVPIKYLLIAEAPPWTGENQVIKYFYGDSDGHLRVRMLLRSLRGAFFKDEHKHLNGETILQKFAEVGFLLVDTLPFSMKYTSSKRRNPNYIKLVKSCKEFFYEQINNNNLKWADDIRIAFALKLNAIAVIETYPNELKFPNGQTISLSKELIATNNANYTDTTKLKKILQLI